MKFSNSQTEALALAAIAGRTHSNATDAFAAAVASFYAAIKGDVAALPTTKAGARQSPEWEAFRDMWVSSYLDGDALAKWRTAQGGEKNTLQNRAVQALNRFRAALGDLAKTGVKVARGDDGAKVSAKAQATKAPAGARAPRDPIATTKKELDACIKRVRADKDGACAFTGHGELIAALMRAHDLVK